MAGLLAAVGLLVAIDTGPSEAKPQSGSDAIQREIDQAQAFYRQKREQVEAQVNAQLGVDYAELYGVFQAKMRELKMKESMISRSPDAAERKTLRAVLRGEYQDPKLYKFLEAHSAFENEIENDHQFLGEYLSRLNSILENLIEQDPLLQYAFESSEFRQQYGTVLRRVVWRATQLKGVSAETVPLNVHSMFANKAKIPILIRLTPAAFSSLSYLRSTLLHELEHAIFYKDRRFSDAKQFAGGATQPADGPFAHYFTSLDPVDPTYQYHLIQEYYSFKAQVLFQEKVGERRHYALKASDRARITSMLEWTQSQLNAKNASFIAAHPTPPVVPLIERFY